MLPETIIDDGLQGFADLGSQPPVPPLPPPQPGNPFPAPWPRPPRQPSGCACGLPRSEYEGHNCPANGWRWTRWPS